MATEDPAQTDGSDEPWFLKVNRPVLLPKLIEATLPSAEYETYITQLLKIKTPADDVDTIVPDSPALTAVTTESTDFTVVSETSTTTGATAMMQDMVINTESEVNTTPTETAVEQSITDQTTVGSDTEPATSEHPFVGGLQTFAESAPEGPRADLEGMMLTDNGALAFRSTKNSLVDLFYELEGAGGQALCELHDAAWREDPKMTLKIIFNARSIHLGKASRPVFYRSAGWLAKNHPRTLIANLRWLSRPVIPKKMGQKKDGEGDEEMVVIEPEDTDDITKYDVRNGVAHGYWKDILNILALCANDHLDEQKDPRDVLNIEKPKQSKRVSPENAKTLREHTREQRHTAVVGKLCGDKPEDVLYRALHIHVARLFAEQLRTDIDLLNSSNPGDRRRISLCAKWAPSADRFHDKHTFITSTIAEILYPEDDFAKKGLLVESKTDTDRAVYLRHARDLYRKDIAALRQHLEVVERDISANTFSNIKYDRVPSTAMSNYGPLFVKKDGKRFKEYLSKVASGKARISGATLLPSLLIKAIRDCINPYESTRTKKRTHAMMHEQMSEIEATIAEQQWKTLVQRIKDSGKLESSIAVCDTSGSMTGGYSGDFTDGTCPLDSAIGLSLLLAEVTEPPFGGTFITFSSRPEVQTIDPSKPLRDKYQQLVRAHWEQNTDFEAVFTKLILPMAVEKKLAPEHMVKRIFVFSDMQFDDARPRYGDAWSTTYENIQKAFTEAGYEVPHMVFWNLDGGRRRMDGHLDPTAPKPVMADEPGVSLVGGYSQGMLKMFLDNGEFKDEEVTEEVEQNEVEGDMVAVGQPRKKAKIDPLSTVKKAVSHKAYEMLEVLD